MGRSSGIVFQREYYPLTENRWHTDIKPDNILYVEERVKTSTSLVVPDTSEPMSREKAFKLADPGFAKFNLKSQVKSQEVPKQFLEGGTKTYGKLLAVDGYIRSHER